ncbi:MAG: response regulator [Gemmatimonadales bacterium]
MLAVLSVVACADLFDTEQGWTPAPSYDPLQAHSSGLGKILVVDDEPAIRRMLSRLLSEAGYQVCEAGDGSEALEIALRDETGLDLVITDVKMPVMDGRELGRLLRATLPELPVLYVSAYAADAAAGLSASGEPAAFVRKPFEPDGLLRKVLAMLRDRGA